MPQNKEPKRVVMENKAYASIERGRKPGRWSQKDADRLSLELLQWIRSDLGSRSQFTFEEIEQRFGVTPARARTVVTDLAKTFLRLREAPNGIRAIDNRTAYYWRQFDANKKLKQAIARKSASLIPETASLACSPGTTVTLAVTRVLEREDYLTIITNNCGLLDPMLYQRNSTIEFTGGTYNRQIHAFDGPQVSREFRERNCTCAIIGVSGIDLDGNLYVKHPSESDILKAIVESATDRVLIVASVDKLAKYDAYGFGCIFTLKSSKDCEVTLVTNSMDEFPKTSDDASRLTNRARALFDKLQKDNLVVVAEADPADVAAG